MKNGKAEGEKITSVAQPGQFALPEEQVQVIPQNADLDP